ncbi:hypothetical protein SUGI_1226750 [Cryptomeria japonica]|uniref:Uncharacterized protein n=1 Tax=Cryptomeria japonica TaxID=3369 RepID=A0AAD3NPU2_CRYJA|nr:hypothetical protein SUGI_1226750 [Cryptomeria japonica]
MKEHHTHELKWLENVRLAVNRLQGMKRVNQNHCLSRLFRNRERSPRVDSLGASLPSPLLGSGSVFPSPLTQSQGHSLIMRGDDIGSRSSPPAGPVIYKNEE